MSQAKKKDKKGATWAKPVLLNQGNNVTSPCPVPPATTGPAPAPSAKVFQWKHASTKSAWGGPPAPAEPSSGAHEQSGKQPEGKKARTCVSWVAAPQDFCTNPRSRDNTCPDQMLHVPNFNFCTQPRKGPAGAGGPSQADGVLHVQPQCVSGGWMPGWMDDGGVPAPQPAGGPQTDDMLVGELLSVEEQAGGEGGLWKLVTDLFQGGGNGPPASARAAAGAAGGAGAVGGHVGDSWSDVIDGAGDGRMVNHSPLGASTLDELSLPAGEVMKSDELLSLYEEVADDGSFVANELNVSAGVQAEVGDFPGGLEVGWPLPPAS